MNRRSALLYVLVSLVVSVLAMPLVSEARNPIRNAFFGLYPVAENTQLDNLPSNANHCGVCHFDFDGGGARNPFGLGIEIGIGHGLSHEEAILAIENQDSDGDGFSNLTEVTAVGAFSNTPTFPGLTAGNVGNISNVLISEVEPYLSPLGAADTTAPVVVVSAPNGGEELLAGSYYAIQYTATDSSGISHINIYLSEDGGDDFLPVAVHEPEGTGFSWFVPNMPGSENRIRVEAIDNAGNDGHDDSDADFVIIGSPPGYVPTTLRDVKLSGTQPHEGAVLDDPDISCASCHGNYDANHEPWFVWRGSMMAQAARDPFFFACMAVAEQDAPSVGDLCIRCHSPGGWQEGRSVDTSGSLLNAKDRHGVHCDFCHREVDHNYVAGASPVEDLEVLEEIELLPLQYGNGQFITDPAPLRRGPYDDAQASHSFVDSPIHRSANMCGICHDVSNPVFVSDGSGDYVPTPFDEEHPDMDVRNMFPVERTFSEWSQSEYAAQGVYAPQFAGNKPDGIVSTCEDCHMRDVDAKGCNQPGAPQRPDLGLHDFAGGNTFVPDILPMFFPDEVDVVQLQAAKQRAIDMLSKAASLEVTPTDFGILVRVTNETGHKLPSGYPEGRRVWIHVVALDGDSQPVYESGTYDFETAELGHDEDLKIYEIHPGISPALAAALGMPAGPSFHFVLSDTVYTDNRLPPRGFTNAGFAAIQSPPVAYEYADGQYWDDTQYHLPATAELAQVTLYYQSTSREYVEFLRDANTTNSSGQALYDAWVAQGKAPPVVMAEMSIPVSISTSAIGEEAAATSLTWSLRPGEPNPFTTTTSIRYAVAGQARVRLAVFDIRGRRVRTLTDEVQRPGWQSVLWDGRDSEGRKLSAGTYLIRLDAGSRTLKRKALLLR